MLRESPERAHKAFQLVVRRALESTAIYRIKFDRKGLQAALGQESLKSLMPHLTTVRSWLGSLLRLSEVHEEPFGPSKTDLLLNALSFGLEDRLDLALNYLYAVEFLDHKRQLVLGIYDQATSVCFRLPEEAMDKLLDDLQRSGLPVEIVEMV
jgi:hypothetical protein